MTYIQIILTPFVVLTLSEQFHWENVVKPGLEIQPSRTDADTILCLERHSEDDDEPCRFHVEKECEVE